MSKLKKCGACSGSGYYDNTGSPKCGACHGLGVERTKMPYRLWKHVAIKYHNVERFHLERVYENK